VLGHVMLSLEGLIEYLRGEAHYASWKCLDHGRVNAIRVDNTEFCVECIVAWLRANGLHRSRVKNFLPQAESAAAQGVSGDRMVEVEVG
jgi:hypothetical protein